jgi:glucokinase
MNEIVAVDIGGTHARFAIAETSDGRIRRLGEVCTLKTAEHASLRRPGSCSASATAGRSRAPRRSPQLLTYPQPGLFGAAAAFALENR